LSADGDIKESINQGERRRVGTRQINAASALSHLNVGAAACCARAIGRGKPRSYNTANEAGCPKFNCDEALEGPKKKAGLGAPKDFFAV